MTLERGRGCPGSGGKGLVCAFQQNTRAQHTGGWCTVSALCSRVVVASATVMDCGLCADGVSSPCSYSCKLVRQK